jgi:hypothetical protein
MDTAAAFREHAAECIATAKASTDPESKERWQRIAERWLLCAKLTKEEEQLARTRRAQRARRYRPSHHSWL